MSCIETFPAYVQQKDFACSHRYVPEEHIWKDCPPFYQFNWAESAGNELLSPMAWVFTQYEDTNPLIIKIGLAFAFVVAAILSVPGAVLKKLGETLNPHSALREQAFAKLQAFAEENPNISHDTALTGTAKFKLTQAFLKNSTPGQEEELRTRFNAWNTAWSEYQKNLFAGENLGPFEQEIDGLMNGNEEIIKEAENYKKGLKKEAEFVLQKDKLGIEYNKIVDQMAAPQQKI